MHADRAWLCGLLVALVCALARPALSSSRLPVATDGKALFEEIEPPIAAEPTTTSRAERGITPVVSMEGTFFWPQMNRRLLHAALDNGVDHVEYSSNSALGSVDGGFLIAPRVTLGLQGRKWGLVSRCWYAAPQASALAFRELSLGATDTPFLFDDLVVYTIDLEIQRRFSSEDWTVYGLFGVRYASISNDRLLGATLHLSDDDAQQARAYAGQQFNGTGITCGFWGIRPVRDGSPLKCFVANRYSIVWGNGLAVAGSQATVIDLSNPSSAPLSTTSAAGAGDLFIGEIQLGLQWDAELQWSAGRAFVRFAAEYQYWDSNAGVIAEAHDDVSSGSAFALAEARAGDLLFSLVGFNLGVGVMY